MNRRTHASFSDPIYPLRAQAKSITILRNGKVVDDDVRVKYTEPEREYLTSSATEERHDQGRERETPEREISSCRV